MYIPDGYVITCLPVSQQGSYVLKKVKGAQCFEPVKSRVP